MNDLSKEYLFLFNSIVCAAEDMRDLQVWVTLQHNIAKSAHSELEAFLILSGAMQKLEGRLQQLQRLFIYAQQRAEEIYLEGENPL